MAEKSVAVVNHGHCAKCRKECEDAGAGFVTVCRYKGRASGQEMATIPLCAGCLREVASDLGVLG